MSPPQNKTSAPAKKQAPAATTTASSEEKKAPTVQEIIGGKSWTGKLPQTLFYEHCVKNGWEKPQYDNKRDKGGFVSTVHIGVKNPRSAEIERISFQPPDLPWVPQPTALESRHFCATYALHRVCSMKNIQHMLPPTHKRLWGAWEDIRVEEKAAGKGWRYEADPFAVKREHELARIKQEQKREAQQKEPKKFKDSKLTLGGGKGWQAVPVVDMGRERRVEAEDLIRRYHVWNPLGITLSKDAQRRIVDELVGLGFRKLHAEEACEWVKDREEALEWLLTHVPEDDVPPRFLPENYSAGITMSTGGSLGVEYAIKRLATIGYSLDLCREVLERNALDEHRAAEALMEMLVHGKQISPVGVVEVDLLTIEQHHDWEEELASLEAIYGAERFKCVSPNVVRITLDMQDRGPKNLPTIILEVRKPAEYSGSVYYPETIPTFAVITEGERKLPAHVRLSIIRQTAEYAETLKGEQMIFTVVDWLENEILRIIANPGRLRDVATAITGSDERKDEPSSVQQKRRRNFRKRSPIDWTPGTKQSLDIMRATEARLNTPAQRKMVEARMRLPAWEARHDIVKAVNEAQVIIISGETGSGKSTQAVQFVLDDLIQRKLGATANIVCTQPRRISALGLADRVSDERCQAVGQEVGYAIRGEAKQTQGVTRVTFVTTGVLLRRLQMGDTLEDISHIVVDEVHERSLDTDFLLILVKRIITKRKDLKIILMSATLDADVFSNYFGGNKVVRRINIEGRTFPVEDIYLDTIIKTTGFTGGNQYSGGGKDKRLDDAEWDDTDPSTSLIIRNLGDRINYNLIAATVTEIDKRLTDTEGAILIFLPGTMEISRCLEAIRFLPGGSSRFHALPLHASLTPLEQRRVFPPAPKGLRKIVAATNVAETSITIEDVVCVIDTGRVKETSFDVANNVVKLQEVWASRAAAKQRRGRAGRVRAGQCYKLYTKGTETRKMPERPEPELKRVPLEQTCLSAKAMGIKDVRAFLAAAISPPNIVAVEGALALLEKMGAVVDDELSALGRHMSMIPADLRCSKLMVYGVLFGCLSSALTIAAILTARSPFSSRMDTREESKKSRVQFAKSQGDLLADCRAWEQWSEKRKNLSRGELRQWCQDNFLDSQVMFDIGSNRSQYIDSLRDTGFLPFGSRSQPLLPTELDRNEGNDILLRALIAGAFTPQIARIQMPEQKFASSSSGALAVDPEARTIKYFSNDSGRVFVHPSSTVFEAKSFPGNAGFMTFFGKMATSKVFLRDCTPVNTYSLLLLGGKVEVDTMGRGITIDSWLRLRGWGRIGVLVRRLRAMLDTALDGMIDSPDTALKHGHDEVVKCVIGLIEGDGT